MGPLSFPDISKWLPLGGKQRLFILDCLLIAPHFPSMFQIKSSIATACPWPYLLVSAGKSCTVSKMLSLESVYPNEGLKLISIEIVSGGDCRGLQWSKGITANIYSSISSSRIPKLFLALECKHNRLLFGCHIYSYLFYIIRRCFFCFGVLIYIFINTGDVSL